MNVRLSEAMPRAELSRAFSPQKSPKQNRGTGFIAGQGVIDFAATRLSIRWGLRIYKDWAATLPGFKAFGVQKFNNCSIGQHYLGIDKFLIFNCSLLIPSSPSLYLFGLSGSTTSESSAFLPFR